METFMVKEGDIITAFSIPTDNGDFELKTNNKNKSVVFFFPRADTSGCTKEAIDFSKLINDFTKLNTVVLGISKDPIEKQMKFRKKYNLKCLLGSDFENNVCEQFSVWVEKSMYGKSYMGIQRSTFIINEKCKVLKTWDKVKVTNHASEVLQTLSELS
jgi:peroxiredoxin Q/BCP